MSIKSRGSSECVIFECDDCGVEINTRETEFREALEVLKIEGWSYEKTSSGWEHFCEGCSSS